MEYQVKCALCPVSTMEHIFRFPFEKQVEDSRFCDFFQLSENSRILTTNQ